jgi:hypothetical protein
MPIIYLNLGTCIHNPKVKNLISERCAKIDIDFDIDNRPILPTLKNSLDTAIANATDKNIAEFQKILMGKQ